MLCLLCNRIMLSLIQLYVLILKYKYNFLSISLFCRQTLNTVRRTVNALNYQKSRSLACSSDERNYQ